MSDWRARHALAERKRLRRQAVGVQTEPVHLPSLERIVELESAEMTTLEDLGTFEGALLFVISLAARWGLLEVSWEDRIEMIGVSLDGGMVEEPGFVRWGEREPGDPWLLLLDCVIANSRSLVDTAELFIGLANDARTVEK